MKFTLGKFALPLYAVLTFIYLLIPIFYTFVFSFNDSLKTNLIWRGFTFDKWLNVCQREGVCQAFGNSIFIGLISTIFATALGTAIAIALVRYRFRFRSSVNLLLFLPMATPEVVLGAGLASQFFNLGVQKGTFTIILAHIMFCLSFVVVTVKARVASLDLLPGISAAALLSFALSFDDFIITNFNAGADMTFPRYVYTAAARGVPAEANVIGSAVFILAIVIVLATQINGEIKRRRLAKKA